MKFVYLPGDFTHIEVSSVVQVKEVPSSTEPHKIIVQTLNKGESGRFIVTGQEMEELADALGMKLHPYKAPEVKPIEDPDEDLVTDSSEFGVVSSVEKKRGRKKKEVAGVVDG